MNCWYNLTMREESIDLVELDFKRDENKYFVPPSFAKAATGVVEKLCVSLGCKKEVHEHPLTRSIYYYLGDTDSMPPGFSVRYREYVDKSVMAGGTVGDKKGFYEVKWLDQYESGRPIKRKLRFQDTYTSELSLESLRTMADVWVKRHDISPDVVASLETYVQALSQNNSLTTLTPLFISEYQRNRFIHQTGEKVNIVSVDNDIHFYQIAKGGMRSTESEIVDLGAIEGCVVEYKESTDDATLRLQLYRILVAHNATRFYGKKGEALNLLQRLRSVDAPGVSNELKGLEIETKFDLSSDLQRSSALVSQLYQYFDGVSTGYMITPGFRYVNSQSTMATYARDPHNKDREGKLLIGLDAKFSTKQIVSVDHGLIVRKEEKGNRFEYNAKQVREQLKGLEKIGKTQRIRRAFYIISQETHRVFKVSIDFNWKLPIQEKDFFSQLEIEYTGMSDGHRTDIQSNDAVYDVITSEVKKIGDEVQSYLVQAGIPHTEGIRKLDHLTSNE